MDIDDHAAELAADLGVEEATVREDLANLVSYSVPLDEAKGSLRRKYGGGSAERGEPETKDLAAVSTEDANVTVTGRVLTVGQRSIRYQGDDLVIFEGEFADESGTIPYTAWEDFDLEPGETVRAVGAGVREWEGAPELNLGSETGIERVDPLDVPYEIGGDRSLSALEPGDRGIAVEVVVSEVERKTIDGRDGETEILSGVLADETGRLPFTDWEPREALAEGESVRIENAYVREFRGVPSVNVSAFSTVAALDRTVEAGADAPTKSVREAVETGGIFDVEVVGNCLAVRDGSGLIQRCPDCGRTLQKGQCRSHGSVDGEDDLRVKAVLDDGTGALTVILGTELTAAVYGGGIEAAREQARDAMDQTVVADTIREKIVGREFAVRGTVSVDDYGANVEARAFAERADDPAERARALLDRADSPEATTARADGGSRHTGGEGRSDTAARADADGAADASGERGAAGQRGSNR
jgi:replication factor A1